MTFVCICTPLTVRSFKLCSLTETRLARLSGEPRSCWRRQTAVAPTISCGAQTAIYDYLLQHNEKPKPFTWTKTADDILTPERRALDKLDEIRGPR